MMRKAFCILAVLGLSATAAHAQTLSPLDGQNSVGSEAAVFLRPVSGQSVQALAMFRLMEDALETSRELNRVDIAGENVMQLEAPVALARMAGSANMSVTYVIWPVRGLDQTFSTTCVADQLDRCAEKIVQHMERMARLDPGRR